MPIVLIANSGPVSGSSFTTQDWEDAGSPPSFEIQNYETVSEGTFQGNTTITNIVFGTGVVTLSYVIHYAPNLVSITIGPDVTTVDFLVMAAPQFTTITLDSGNTTFHLDNGILYKKDGSNNTHTLVQYPLGKAPEAFSIPSTVEIIGIGAAMTSNITSLNVPASVQIIRDSAFFGCRGMTDVTFAAGSGLLTVERKAFYDTALASIAIPASVTSILKLAFSNSSLTTITVDSNNSTFYVENNTLYQKSGINNTHTLVQYPIGRTEVTYIIPNTVEIIGMDAFYDATNITSLEIPASVKTISSGSFAQSGITSFTFAEGSVLETIDWSAFGSTAFTSIIIPASVTTIEPNAFGNSALTSIVIPASVTTIGMGAFRDCSDLTSVTFIESTVSATGITIGDDAFTNTTVLASVFIKDGQVVINNSTSTAITTTLGTTGAFFGSSTSVVIRSYEIAGTGVFGASDYTDAFSPPYAVLTNSDATGWTSIGDSAVKSNTTITYIHIPATVQTIGYTAFEGDTNLTTVTFAANSELTTIGVAAFAHTAITSIEIPASVTSIMNSAFYSNYNLTSVTFAASSLLTTIWNGAFNQTGITSIIIPASVTEIKEHAFMWCTSLTTVTFIASTDWATGITIDVAAFDTTNALDTINIANGQKINNVAITSPGTMSDFYGHTGSVTLVLISGGESSAPPAPICFPAGTPILTDQGEVAIDKIDPKKHTIRANKIEGITETTSIENYVVMIKKDAFASNVPCRDTTISANHKIMFNNQMIQAREFVDKKEFIDTIYKVAYTGETLYNVLLEDKHDLMIVNNIIAETLSPNSVNAWLFRKMKSDISNAERKEVMDAYMQRVFPSPVLSLSSFMIGCK